MSLTLITPELIALKREFTESLYTGTMNVIQNQWVKDEDTGIKYEEWVTIYENIPCRMTKQEIEPSENRPKTFYKKITVDCAPEIDLPEGSKFEITFNGRTETYERSGTTSIYSDHQRIDMIIYGDERTFT